MRVGSRCSLRLALREFTVWSDIESASIFRVRFLLIPMMSSIHLRLRSTSGSAGGVRRAAGALVGWNVSFPAFFDWSAEEIMEKIEFYRRRSGVDDRRG